jgi:type II secretory pathway component PulM
MKTNPNDILTALGVWLSFLTVALGLIARWVLANQPTIIALIKEARELRAIATQHDEQISEITTHASSAGTSPAATPAQVAAAVNAALGGAMPAKPSSPEVTTNPAS